MVAQESALPSIEVKFIYGTVGYIRMDEEHSVSSLRRTSEIEEKK
jgi:hypothetical protein